MPKLLKKIAIVASIILTLVGSLTFVMTYQNIGFTDNFVSKWLSSLALAAVVIAPIGFLLITLMGRIVKKCLPNSSDLTRKFAVAISMAVIMESVLAVVTTLNNLGMTDAAEFAQNWFSAFTLALPLGIFIGLIMTLFIKPRLEKYMAS